MRVLPLVCVCVFFRGVILSSRVTGACPVTTDLIMRVNVRTTTTTATTTTWYFSVLLYHYFVQFCTILVLHTSATMLHLLVEVSQREMYLFLAIYNLPEMDDTKYSHWLLVICNYKK